MKDAERWQADAVRSARTRDLPSPATLDGIWQGLEARVAAGAADPLGDATIVEDQPSVVQASEASVVRWQTWAVGGVLAAAAAVALIVGAQVTTTSAVVGDDNPSQSAAAYEVRAGSSEGDAVSRTPRRRPQRKSPTPTAAGLPDDTQPPAGDPEPQQPAALAADDDPFYGPELPAVVPTPSRRSTPAPSRPRAAHPAAPAPVTNVAGEAEALRKAHAAMEAGRLTAARRALKEYRDRFPGGVLQPEAKGLGVLIGCKQGRDGAGARARAYLRAQPEAVLRPRLESACENLDETETDPGDSRH